MKLLLLLFAIVAFEAASATLTTSKCGTDNICGGYNPTSKLFTNQLCSCPVGTSCQEGINQKVCRPPSRDFTSPTPCWYLTDPFQNCNCWSGACLAPAGQDSNCP